jgi:hypothetical protein
VGISSLEGLGSHGLGIKRGARLVQ